MYRIRFFELLCADMDHFIHPVRYLKQTDASSLENTRKLRHYVIAALSIEFRAVLAFRIYSELWRAGWHRTSYVLYLISKRNYPIDIHPNADIGPGLRIGHAFDIVIGPSVIIGKYAVIFNGATLGNRRLVAENNMPTLGDYVKVGTGAKLIGNITIGSNSTIGANSVVLENVPENGTWVGTSGVSKLKLIRKNAE